MKKLSILATLAVASLTLTACGAEHSGSCEWERKPFGRSAQKPGNPKGMTLSGFEAKSGGSASGGSRGGSTRSSGGSSGGSRPNLNKGSGSSSGGSGGAAKPRYNKSNPPPKPSSPAGSGMRWVLDCD